MPAEHARDGEPLRAGRIYVAPPGRHLLVREGRARLSMGPKINRQRPAIDAMLTSAARWADGGTVAGVLSGLLDDGAVGAALVARAGGQVLAQAPEEAQFGSMPLAALRAAPGAVALSGPELGAMAGKLIEARHQRAEGSTRGAKSMPPQRMEESGDPSYLAPDETALTRMRCPECGGPLARIDLPRISYYRCHVGHQFAPRTLEAAQLETAEATLWAAVAALEEHAALAGHLAEADGPDQLCYRHSAERSTELARSVRAELDRNLERLGRRRD